MNRPLFNAYPRAVGQLALYEMFSLQIPEPLVGSYIIQGNRKSDERQGYVTENYPVTLEPENTALGHLRFSLKHEAFDLGLIIAALEQIGAQTLEEWVRSEPTSAYARRAWFLYEFFLEKQLNLEPVRAGNYAPLLDSNHFYVGKRQNSSRHRIINNLLGTASYCPTVRRTERLRNYTEANFDQEIRTISANYDANVLARATHYLYTKETRSTFDLERERPSANRMDLFVQALRKAASFDVLKTNDFVSLQNDIVDPRYAERNWRSVQNFIGETLMNYQQRVHCVFPRPNDVMQLMQGWMQLCKRMLNDEIHPVIIAAVGAFGFVFIHPFEDGNGRLHRFLLHHFLAKTSFTPSDLIFPLSASILRDRQGYDRTLEVFSKRTMPFVQWDFTKDHDLVVRNDTRALYRFWDATLCVEYVFERIDDTLRQDFVTELRYLVRYDSALEAIRDVLDMPDRKVSLFIRLCMQNNGKLSKTKRGTFSELSDMEIQALEDIVQRILVQ